MATSASPEIFEPRSPDCGAESRMSIGFLDRLPKLLKDFVEQSDAAGLITVDAGFVTDLASLSHAVLSLFGKIAQRRPPRTIRLQQGRHVARDRGRHAVLCVHPDGRAKVRANLIFL